MVSARPRGIATWSRLLPWPSRRGPDFPHHSSRWRGWGRVAPAGVGQRTATPHTAMSTASPAGRHRSIVCRGVIRSPSFPTGGTFGLPCFIGDFGANIESSPASAPGTARQGAPPLSSPEDNPASDGVHIPGQSRLPATPAIAEYGVFSTPHTVARLLL